MAMELNDAVNLLEIKRSLEFAQVQTGTEPTSVEALLAMNGVELLSRLAPLGIRFCVKDKDAVKPTPI